MLPDEYASWLRELLGTAVSDEPPATCGDCPMCRSDEPGGSARFDPRSKCCTYTPELPNFLIGRALRRDDPVARQSLLERMGSEAIVTPLGISRVPAQAALYESKKEKLFGRSLELRCPHFLPDTGYCALWRDRNAVCATWFCRHGRGANGQRFWSAVRRLLSACELALARHCALELGLGSEALGALLLSSPAGTWPGATLVEIAAEQAPATWGPWLGREEELFVRCAEIVEPLRWPEVLAMTGAHGRLLAELVRQQSRALSAPALPERLHVAAFQAEKLADGAVQVLGYSAVDPLTLPAELVDALACFDGRPTGEAARLAEQTFGVSLDAEQLRTLWDFGLLAPDDERVPR